MVSLQFESEIHQCRLCVSYGVSDDTMLTRMRGRAETSGRADDNEETMRERIKTFHNHAVPVLKWVSQLFKLLNVIKVFLSVYFESPICL